MGVAEQQLFRSLKYTLLSHNAKKGHVLPVQQPGHETPGNFLGYITFIKDFLYCSNVLLERNVETKVISAYSTDLTPNQGHQCLLH
ncbi:UNVERIFIED_CONTAM: hypothetical protein FKN15_062270 [Acipenser sinensis]